MNPCHPLRSLLFRSAIIAATSFFAINAPAQVTLEALRRDGYGMVPIDLPQPNRLVVPATINGTKMRLILDTGWAGEGISLASVHARHATAGAAVEKSEGESASGKKLAFEKKGAGTVVMGNVQMQGVPLSFGNFRGLEGYQEDATSTHITMNAFNTADGFLSSGFLRTCSAVVDLHNRRLYLRPPGTGKRASLGPALTAVGLAAVPFTQSSGNCIADVEINGTPARMFVDTGAVLSGIDARFAARVKASGTTSRIESRDAAGVVRESQKATLSSFKIAGVEVRGNDMHLSNYGFYSSGVVGIIGMDILGQNWSIIDFGEHKLYIAKAH